MRIERVGAGRARPLLVVLTAAIGWGAIPLPKTGTGRTHERGLRETLWSGKDPRIQG